MKTLFLIIAIMFTGMVASAQEDFEPTQLAIKPWAIMNTDSQAVVVAPGAVGLLSKTVFLAITKHEGRESAYIGYSSDSTGQFNGIYVTDSGQTVFINASKVIISRPSYASHAQADASLLHGQEYFLMGDRAIYRKP